MERRLHGCGWPGPGSDLVVVLDGGSGRFAVADRMGQAPPQPTPELLQGFDTVTQITALAHWLRHQPLPRIALGSQGIRVGPADLPTPSPAERRKLVRDVLRLTLWRATGCTGAWLAPEIVARKRADCGV